MRCYGIIKTSNNSHNSKTLTHNNQDKYHDYTHSQRWQNTRRPNTQCSKEAHSCTTQLSNWRRATQRIEKHYYTNHTKKNMTKKRQQHDKEGRLIAKAVKSQIEKLFQKPGQKPTHEQITHALVTKLTESIKKPRTPSATNPHTLTMKAESNPKEDETDSWAQQQDATIPDMIISSKSFTTHSTTHSKHTAVHKNQIDVTFKAEIHT